MFTVLLTAICTDTSMCCSDNCRHQSWTPSDRVTQGQVCSRTSSIRHQSSISSNTTTCSVSNDYIAAGTISWSHLQQAGRLHSARLQQGACDAIYVHVYQPSSPQSQSVAGCQVLPRRPH